MIKVIGVRFRTAGKVYYFDPLEFQVSRGDHVIVETARGIEFGTVVCAPKEVDEEAVVQPLKPVLRVATERDVEQEQNNKLKEREAFKVCQERIRKHGLEMKLIDAEYTFDNNKVLFYFTADGRIDFRELVKDLAGVFRTRIELRQIGVRDETKILGGIGICGRPLCCHSYLSDFIPVSIKMAKEQNLSLNPTKISGVCGRLMCCLKHEEDAYEDLNKRLPGIGDRVTLPDGTTAEVQSVNVLKQLVKVCVMDGDEKTIQEYRAEELHFKRKHTKKERLELSPEELKELEELEWEDIVDEDQERSGGRKQRDRGRDGQPAEGQAIDGTQAREGQGNGPEAGKRQDGTQRQDRNEGRRNEGRRHDRGRREDRNGEGRNEQRENRGGNEQRENAAGEAQGAQHDNGQHEGGNHGGRNGHRNRHRRGPKKDNTGANNGSQS